MSFHFAHHMLLLFFVFCADSKLFPNHEQLHRMAVDVFIIPTNKVTYLGFYSSIYIDFQGYLLHYFSKRKKKKKVSNH